MWKFCTLICFASVVLTQTAAQGGAESVPFHGYLPGANVRAPAPDGDGQPNDIYEHIPVARPALRKDQVVIYPHHLGFEYGQDSEHRIYEVHTAKELADLAHGHSKHGKHGKHDHHHHHKGHKGAHGKAGKSLPTTTTTTTPKPKPTTTRKPAARKPSYPPSPYPAYPPPPPGAYPPRGSYPAPPHGRAPPPYPYQRPQFPPVHG